MDYRIERRPINPPVLAAEMTAAIGAAWNGYSERNSEPDTRTLHFADGTPDAVIARALKVYTAHDAETLTAEQQAQAQQAAALEQLAQTDFSGMVQAVEGAATLEDVRPLLVDALGALNALTKALGLKG